MHFIMLIICGITVFVSATVNAMDTATRTPLLKAEELSSSDDKPLFLNTWKKSATMDIKLAIGPTYLANILHSLIENIKNTPSVFLRENKALLFEGTKQYTLQAAKIISYCLFMPFIIIGNENLHDNNLYNYIRNALNKNKSIVIIFSELNDVTNPKKIDKCLELFKLIPGSSLSIVTSKKATEIQDQLKPIVLSLEAFNTHVKIGKIKHNQLANYILELILRLTIDNGFSKKNIPSEEPTTCKAYQRVEAVKHYKIAESIQHLNLTKDEINAFFKNSCESISCVSIPTGDDQKTLINYIQTNKTPCSTSCSICNHKKICTGIAFNVDHFHVLIEKQQKKKTELGYREDTDPNKNAVCGICLNSTEKRFSLQCPQCKQPFCEYCLEQHLREQDNCPHCRVKDLAALLADTYESEYTSKELSPVITNDCLNQCNLV